jgi:hypothetical protein
LKEQGKEGENEETSCGGTFICVWGGTVRQLLTGHGTVKGGGAETGMLEELKRGTGCRKLGGHGKVVGELREDSKGSLDCGERRRLGRGTIRT